MHCAIWYHFYSLKNVINTHGGVLISVKLTLLHGCFSRFLNCPNGTKSLNASHICNLRASYSFILYTPFNTGIEPPVFGKRLIGMKSLLTLIVFRTVYIENCVLIDSRYI